MWFRVFCKGVMVSYIFDETSDFYIWSNSVTHYYVSIRVL